MFSSLLLDEPLHDAIKDLGFSEMTAVQLATTAKALEGKNLIVNAKTGSGKTLAYVLPLLQQILDNPQSTFQQKTQALILAPTRDLCRQINKQCSLLAKYTNIRTAVIMGGEDPKYQIKALQQFPDIVIATPARLIEHAKRDVIDLDNIQMLVLDEADRMLTMGFSEDVLLIGEHCNEECQCLMFSASFNQKKFSHLIDKLISQPEIIMVDSAHENNVNTQQYKILADDTQHKLKISLHLMTHDDYQKTIIFANKKETVSQISGYFQANQITSAILHSDVAQDVRNKQLRKFRLGEINILVATDVASRGLDIAQLDLVINFDVPRNGEDYMHRIGRCGRMFEQGRAITLVTSYDWNKMIGIENFLKCETQPLLIESLKGRFTQPKNTKASGKFFGTKRKKSLPKTTLKKKNKNRVRDKKNIGKRRQPSEKKD